MDRLQFWARSSFHTHFSVLSSSGMPPGGICPPSTSLFTGSSHQSFQGANFHTAGQDMFMPIVNVNFTRPNSEVVATPLGLSSAALLVDRGSSERPVLGLPAMHPPRNRLLGRFSHLLKSKKRERTVYHESPLIEQASVRSEPSSEQVEKREILSNECSSDSSPTVYESNGISVVRSRYQRLEI